MPKKGERRQTHPFLMFQVHVWVSLYELAAINKKSQGRFAFQGESSKEVSKLIRNLKQKGAAEGWIGQLSKVHIHHIHGSQARPSQWCQGNPCRPPLIGAHLWFIDSQFFYLAGPVHAVICDMSPLRIPRAWVVGGMLSAAREEMGQNDPELAVCSVWLWLWDPTMKFTGLSDLITMVTTCSEQ